MKKVFCLLCVLTLLLCGCFSDDYFVVDENLDLISPSGETYTCIAWEDKLSYFGDLEFIGRVKGDDKYLRHLGGKVLAGMFAFNGSSDNVLIRTASWSEWRMIYRKASLPEFDFSVDNCIRIEYMKGTFPDEDSAVHVSCGAGLTNPEEIAAFLSDVRSQQSPEEAGLDDLIKNPDGTYERCYIDSALYGFFAEEPNLAVQMYVTSYNDLAYSVNIEGAEYVLPEYWRQRLLSTQCDH